MNKKIKEKIEDLIVLIAGAIIWISFYTQSAYEEENRYNNEEENRYNNGEEKARVLHLFLGWKFKH